MDYTALTADRYFADASPAGVPDSTAIGDFVKTADSTPQQVCDAVYALLSPTVKNLVPVTDSSVSAKTEITAVK